jgi:autotransporter translocation and assembly factor TamB
VIKLILNAFLYSILRVAAVILLGAIGLIYFLGETTAGLQTLIHIATPWTPGLRIGEIHGALFSNISLKQISYQNTNLLLSIDQVNVEWTPAALYQHQLKINKIEIAHVQSHTYSSTRKTQAEPFDLQKMAFLKNILVDHISVQDITLIHDQYQPVKIAAIALEKTTSEATHFQINTLDGELNGTAILDWTAPFTWSLAINGKNINPGIAWTEWPGNLNFTLNAQGHTTDKKAPMVLAFNLRELNGKLRNYPVSSSIYFQLQHDELQVQHAQVKIADSYGEFSGSLAQNWNLIWKLRIPNLLAVLPKSTGSLQSAGSIHGPRFAPRIQATLEANQLKVATDKVRRLTGTLDLTVKPDTTSSLSINAYDLKIHDHPLKKIALDLSGQVNINRDNWITHLDIAIAKQRYIRILLTLPKTTNEKNYLTQPITALININFPNLRTLKDSLPEIKNPQGIMQGSLQLQGSLSHPTVQGEVKLSKGNLTIPKLGIQIRNINLRVAGNQTRHMNYTGSFQSGTGHADLQGTTDLSRADFATEIALRGTNLEVISLPEYKIQVSPDLKLHVTKADLHIDGKLSIPKADLTPKDFRQTITLPDDVVFVGAKTTTAASLLDSMPTMQLTVKIDNHAFIHYQDLTTTLGGSLVLNTSPNNPATASGELYTMGGTYHSYGQDLKISEGRLIYTGGPINNPGLNIKAVRELNTVITGNTGSFTSIQTYGGTQVLTVGVQILGTIATPAVTLFSQPAGLGQDDILSYLLLGIPRSQASIKDSLAILNATSALNIAGSAPSKFSAITKKLQTGLGLTELNVASVQTFDPTANQNMGGVVGTTSLVLGKKIANNLYLHYSVSLFSATPVNILNLRYQFSKHWSVQSETSTIDNGADLLYSLESD